MKDDVLYRYFSDVASSLTIPCLLYKAPQFSGGLDLSIGLIKKCARHPNIVGIKDSSGGGIEKIQYSVPEKFSVLTGSANTFFSALLGGAVGGVLSIANYLPELTMDLYNCIIKNDINRAKELNRQVIALNIEVSGTYGVAGVKCAMDQTGYFGEYPRLPLEPISAEGLHTVKQAIDTVRK
jgi:4-hydroxy-2-oxoglutarate aldolase